MDIESNNNDKKIRDQLYEEFTLLQQQLNGVVDKPDHDLAYGKKKLIPSCRHELIFNINANVLEADELGNAIATKAICTKNYHIPVPSDKDYNVYMAAFFEYLEQCIAQSATQAKNGDIDKNG